VDVTPAPPDPPRRTFRKWEHLRRPQDFQRVYDRRRSVSDGVLLVYARENSMPYLRIGLSVSRKYGRAVQRNRLRRLFREAFRLTRTELPTGLDLILIPRSGQEPTLATLQGSLRKLVPQVARKLAREVPPP
jgi:ribonuclease P protein component